MLSAGTRLHGPGQVGFSPLGQRPGVATVQRGQMGGQPQLVKVGNNCYSSLTNLQSLFLSERESLSLSLPLFVFSALSFLTRSVNTTRVQWIFWARPVVHTLFTFLIRSLYRVELQSNWAAIMPNDKHFDVFLFETDHIAHLKLAIWSENLQHASKLLII